MARRRRPPDDYVDPDGISPESMARWRRQVREFIRWERAAFRERAALARERITAWQLAYARGVVIVEPPKTRH
jgi:hypothetical protein